MVALDNSAVLGNQRRWSARLPSITLEAFTAAVCGLLTLAVIASYGFSDNGLRMGSQIAWRFTSFVFVAAVAAGPLARLVPAGLLRGLIGQRRHVIWSFCASFTVYIASIIVPNTIRHDGLTPGLLVFTIFGAGLTAVIAFTVTRKATELLGDVARRAILAVGISYFWLTYALTGLAHLSGPHRPDAFFGISLSLMIGVLLLRFADRFVLKLRGLRPAV